MLAEMYKKRERLAYFFLAATLLVVAAWMILQTPRSTGEWLEMLLFLVPIGLIASVIFISRAHYNKVKDIRIPQSEKSLLDTKEIVIKRDAAMIPRLLLFEKSGQHLGSVELAGVSWWMYPFFMLDASLVALFPMTYKFIDCDGNSQIVFRKTGWLKRAEVEIFNRANEKVGMYIQEELKAIVHIRGILYNTENEQLLSIKASGFSGSFSWNDLQGKRWAYFYNGMFPHEYTHLFRDIQNDIVELSDDLSDEDKIRLLSVIGYIFFTRIKQ